MFAYPRRLALGIASLAGLLLGLGLVSLSATPAVATTCGSISYTDPGNPSLNSTLSDCSEIITINGTPSSPVFSYSNPNPGYSTNGYLIGVVNNTGSTILDLQIKAAFSSLPIFNFVSSDALCHNTTLSNCAAGPTGYEGALRINGVYLTGDPVYFNLVKGDVIFASGLTTFTSGDQEVALFALSNPASGVCVTDSTGNCVPPPPVSEPATIGIFLAGLLGFGILRHRRRVRAASPRRPRPKRQARRIRHLGWISRLWAAA